MKQLTEEQILNKKIHDYLTTYLHETIDFVTLNHTFRLETGNISFETILTTLDLNQLLQLAVIFKTDKINVVSDSHREPGFSEYTPSWIQNKFYFEVFGAFDFLAEIVNKLKEER